MLFSGIETAFGAGRIPSAVVAVCSYTPAQRDDRLDSPGHPEIEIWPGKPDPRRVVPLGAGESGARSDSIYSRSCSEPKAERRGGSASSRRLNLHKFSYILISNSLKRKLYFKKHLTMSLAQKN